MLTQILDACGLSNQLLNLLFHIELFILLEVPARQLLLDAREDLNGTGILNLAVLVALRIDSVLVDN